VKVDNVLDWYYGEDMTDDIKPGPPYVNGYGVAWIARERRRQIETEGWTKEHDAEHVDGELVCAAIAYSVTARTQVLFPGYVDQEGPPTWWPWDTTWWKPSADSIRNLVKAGALIAAEIDRLQALE
jgi:hypothetical protein